MFELVAHDHLDFLRACDETVVLGVGVGDEHGSSLVDGCAGRGGAVDDDDDDDFPDATRCPPPLGRFTQGRRRGSGGATAYK